MPTERLKSARRIVVKVGSNVMTARASLNLEVIDALSRQICVLMDQGIEVIFVSSGAMAAGLRKLGLQQRPEEIPMRQAIAAVGQSGLMHAYEKVFEHRHKKVAQILLTSEDLNNRRRYLNIRNAMGTLLDWKVVPIVNENDTVMVDEIKLGDNDNLAAMITLLMDADILISLTDIDGLYTKDPRTQPDARLIERVVTYKKEIEHYASHIPGALGTGGMLSKIKAAKKVTAAGIPMIIAKGDKPDILIRLFSGETHGTYFVPREKKLASRKCWIAYTLTPKGTLIIDAGAARALVANGKSLLAGGIMDVQGEFGVGAAVTLESQTGETVGTGLVNYEAGEIRLIKGLRTSQIKSCLGEKPYDEVVHRNNLVLADPDI